MTDQTSYRQKNPPPRGIFFFLPLRYRGEGCRDAANERGGGECRDTSRLSLRFRDLARQRQVYEPCRDASRLAILHRRVHQIVADVCSCRERDVRRNALLVHPLEHTTYRKCRDVCVRSPSDRGQRVLHPCVVCRACVTDVYRYVLGRYAPSSLRLPETDYRDDPISVCLTPVKVFAKYTSAFAVDHGERQPYKLVAADVARKCAERFK